jgi:hypothetical protein
MTLRLQLSSEFATNCPTASPVIVVRDSLYSSMVEIGTLINIKHLLECMTITMRPAPIRHNVWRDLMPSKFCACCGLPFQPLPQVPDQTYCSKHACQRARKQRWNHQKLENDPDYRDNKQRSQRDWMDRNSGYWRQYRADNPDYTDRNRSRQRAKTAPSKPTILAKKDESNGPQTFKAGVYRITPIQRADRENDGTWTVELSPICLNSDCTKNACKVDACKDRT